MLALTVWAWWLAWHKRLFTTPAYLRAANWAIPIGYVAVTAGWMTTEVGRQPFVVYGLLRTADAVTPTITGGDVLASLLLYIAVYFVIFGAGVYYLVRTVKRGLPATIEPREPRLVERPARPMSAAIEQDS
jgi:cytochrome d ubiquinol oxidase subunit I